MTKYRKKPIVIDAEQWSPDTPVSGVHKLDPTSAMKLLPEENEGFYDMCRMCGEIYGNHGSCQTSEGLYLVCPGDWIITGIKGERYPCKPDIFEATYELVEGE